MKTTLFAIFAIAISLGYAYAYADTYQDTVKFDLFANATVSERACYFSETESNGLDYNCQWHVSTVNATQFVEEMQDAFADLVEEIKEEQGITDDTLDTPPVKPLTQTERLMEKLQHEEELGTISTADTELLRLLEATKDACELGIEEGARLQQYKTFEIPSIDPRLDTAVKYGANVHLGKIVKKFEECNAWNDYRGLMLGERYMNMIIDDSTSQKNHRDMVQSLETYPHDKLDAHDFAESQEDAKELICSSSLYHYSFKKDTGCFEKLEIAPSLGLPIRDSSAYKNYLEYMTAGTVDLDTLKKKEVDRAVQESLSSFAQRHGIDIDDLKNLVQSVDEYNESKINGAEKLP